MTTVVAMQRGRGGDRLALARLRVQRRWLVRACTMAGVGLADAPFPTGPGPSPRARR